MRRLPLKTDADSVIEIGAFLDGRGKSTPVSIAAAKVVLRKRLVRKLSEPELERLLVEMCATRGLAMIFDETDLRAR